MLIPNHCRRNTARRYKRVVEKQTKQTDTNSQHVESEDDKQSDALQYPAHPEKGNKSEDTSEKSYDGEQTGEGVFIAPNDNPILKLVDRSSNDDMKSRPSDSCDDECRESNYKVPKLEDSADIDEFQQEDKHKPSRIPATDKRKYPQRRCAVCSKQNGIKRNVRYYCKVCPEEPALCKYQCFQMYHSM